jgi:alpha-L-rhamnosidase
MLIDLEDEDGLISSKSAKLTNELMKKLGFRNEFKEEVKKFLGLKNYTHKILDIVDWPQSERDGYEMVEINTVVNSFYYMNLKLMSKIAGCLGKKEDSLYYYTKSITVKNTINTILFNKEKRIYIDGKHSTHSSLHANMFPLAFGLVPSEQIQSVVAFIKTKGMACSPYGAKYLLEGLYNANEADYALTLMTALHDRSWWNMIKSGATITMEAWDMKYKSDADWNHAWGTAPANIITRLLWGIIPVQPGFNKVQIKPQLSNLAFSKIKVPTIKGYIIAEYKQNNKKSKEYIIEIPVNMKADFIFLDQGNPKISLNKKRIKPIFGLICLNSGYNIIKIKQ